jgi:hypothetical protein
VIDLVRRAAGGKDGKWATTFQVYIGLALEIRKVIIGAHLL